jgi:CBS domain containing-hemolysin-like protein
MCPRVDVFALESDMKIIDIIGELKAKGFSRVPVYEENLDKITGFYMLKIFYLTLRKKILIGPHFYVNLFTFQRIKN